MEKKKIKTPTNIFSALFAQLFSLLHLFKPITVELIYERTHRATQQWWRSLKIAGNFSLDTRTLNIFFFHVFESLFCDTPIRLQLNSKFKTRKCCPEKFFFIWFSWAEPLTGFNRTNIWSREKLPIRHFSTLSSLPIYITNSQLITINRFRREVELYCSWMQRWWTFFWSSPPTIVIENELLQRLMLAGVCALGKWTIINGNKVNRFVDAVNL